MLYCLIRKIFILFYLKDNLKKHCNLFQKIVLLQVPLEKEPPAQAIASSKGKVTCECRERT